MEIQISIEKQLKALKGPVDLKDDEVGYSLYTAMSLIVICYYSSWVNFSFCQ